MGRRDVDRPDAAKVEVAKTAEQLARELAGLLDDPAHRLGFARRFIALEEQVAALAKRLDAAERGIAHVKATYD